jgi:cytochrome c oxidase subunit 2
MDAITHSLGGQPMKHTMKKPILLLIFTILMLALAACGGKKSESSEPLATGPATGELTIIATNWKFDQPEYRVRKGETLTVKLDSKEGTHAIKITGINTEIKPNSSKDITFSKAGTYEIYCSFLCGTGHAGMRSKLIVEE